MEWAERVSAGCLATLAQASACPHGGDARNKTGASTMPKIMGLIRLRGSPVWKSSFAPCGTGCLGSSQPFVSSPTGFDPRPS
mgnify:CR=1 FL=1